MARTAVGGGVWLTLATDEPCGRLKFGKQAGNEAKRWACETKYMGDFALEGAKSAVRNHLFVSSLSIGKSRSRRNDAGFHGGRG